MTELLTSLSDSESVLVADASTAINLNATGCSEAILNALPNRVVVVDLVADELEDGRQKGRNDADKLGELVAAALIEIVTLGQEGLTYFESLVVGAARETLDDGEAATIAYAAESGTLALIDERKANRICARRFPKLRLGCTVDVFANVAVQRALGRQKLADAVFNALQSARMQVLPHHIEWVVGLIGIERASRCCSLPHSVRSRSPKRHTGMRS